MNTRDFVIIETYDGNRDEGYIAQCYPGAFILSDKRDEFSNPRKYDICGLSTISFGSLHV